eukprot:CAMPEP_0113319764 /NCGR_PEP_ID=MMETSP0010_2-20120614/13835_1 /TAXON_ID=216773 ORGANISM="Corethron hystrix, Strain 308" /NCGR_SAMPLE_ID=MMETSP0010_2 /ASSEMBLY_ACC=CAM_ASM_000155 /LENGTH=666 /DNA_ID=CAMNT_0000177397 /DNA_START=347 /DNA_END=2347 /DNA_ORIENTATION=- /assembly_acc=CAM_ASM_000155
MEPQTVEAEGFIINQGDIGDYFYVVEDGEINFVIDGKVVGQCTRGGSFGELALLYDCPRNASCVAITDCKLWRVDQTTFRYILANNTATDQRGVIDVLKKVPFLSGLDPANMNKITDALTSVTFQDGERIITKGDVGEVFYIIREGTVEVSDIGLGDSQYVDQILKAGDSFGERALMTGDVRAANITAKGEVSCLCLSRDVFEKVLGPLQDLLDKAMTKSILMGMPIFANSHFESFEMDQLTELVEDRPFAKGTVVEENHQAIYIIRSGKASVSNPNGLINTLKDGDHFGGTALVEPQDVSKQTITVIEDATLGILTSAAIKSVIIDLSRLDTFLPAESSKLDQSILLKDLVKIRILGVGSFGKVWLVSHGKTEKPYALKMLSKHEIIDNKQVDGVIREKNILASVKHPLIVNLVSSFQDDTSLYMLQEILQGGELFSVVHSDRGDGVPFKDAVFYAACVLESLSHLHKRRICYRDLKPENVLIDGDGYCVLVDLGFAKVVEEKTYTLCGTPEYLAPEIILSKGHDKGVDYWAFGVLIFELLVGRTPFLRANQMAMFQSIVKVKYTFPPSVLNDVTKDIVELLIKKRVSNRLGCLANADSDVREHAFFQGIENEELLSKKIKAPWVPSLHDPLDVSNFESYKHIEQAKEAKRAILSSKQQELFADF